MNDTNFTTTLLVNTTPEKAFDAICNVRGWWSTSLKGGSQKLGDEFIYQYKDLHISTQKIIELKPGKVVVWQVSNSSLSFIKNKNEWDGSTISFDISEKDGQTVIEFTHHGLVPAIECFEACSGGWTHYLHKSLVPLINTGKGSPD